MSTRTYRCLNCLDHTVTRGFDVSHVSITCPQCGSFERLINDAVYDQFRAFESAPPEDVGWEHLDRTEKLLICERVVRKGRSLEDFEPVD